MPRRSVVPQGRALLAEIVRPLASSALVTFLALAALEWAKTGLVTNVFNPIWLLIFAIFSGMVTVLMEPLGSAKRARTHRLLILCVSIVVGNALYFTLPPSPVMYRIVPWIAGAVTYLALLTIPQYD